MMRMSAADASVLDEIAAIAVMPGDLVERAKALLKPLQRITPCDAAFITAFDPERRVQTPLLRHGYTAAVMRALDGPQLTDDVEQAGLHGPSLPVRMGDLPVPVETLPTWSQHLYPAGIRQFLSTGLFARDGRYLGVVATNSADPRPATEAARLLLARAAPWIGHAVDPLRTVSAIARLVGDAVAGVALTRAADIVPLTGLPGHPLLAPGSPVVLAAAARTAGGHPLTTFLCPDDGEDPGGGLFRVSMLACPPQPPGHLRRVLLLSPAPYPHGLTRHELQILGLLIEGWPLARIAVELSTGVRVLTGDVELILAKLGAASRHMAAARALRRGVYIPAELTRSVRREQR
ncbi:hypothetical protein AB0J80_30675 [Actinoplanes sp. NPDC049548]|uniref:helix-turn-helix transcriptional regulator n=1 Tax=Actinoplanes sp. NPDC049548 TaxID=3155152 RepID=UPI003419000D